MSEVFTFKKIFNSRSRQYAIFLGTLGSDFFILLQNDIFEKVALFTTN